MSVKVIGCVKFPETRGKDRLIKYQYKGYYLVGFDRVFNDLKAAVRYCEENELDPVESIKTNDPEVLNTCKKIAAENLRALDEVKEALRKSWYKQADEIHRRAKARDDYKAEVERAHTRDWDSELLQEKVIEAIGVHSGIYEAMQVLDVVREPYFNILWKITKW